MRTPSDTSEEEVLVRSNHPILTAPRGHLWSYCNETLASPRILVRVWVNKAQVLGWERCINGGRGMAWDLFCRIDGPSHLGPLGSARCARPVDM
jgi:hypothetical protein